jgi:hypothetical protein
MSCFELLESVHGIAKAGALGSNEACAKVLERYSGFDPDYFENEMKVEI